MQDEGTGRTFRIPGVHDDDDPEYSILKARMVNKMKEEQLTVDRRFDLVEVTKLAERTITADLERLIGKAVDPRKADYAVITGVQIHNWAVNLDDPHSYSMEFVAPSSVYCVVNGVATHLDLGQIPQVGLSTPGVHVYAWHQHVLSAGGMTCTAWCVTGCDHLATCLLHLSKVSCSSMVGPYP